MTFWGPKDLVRSISLALLSATHTACSVGVGPAPSTVVLVLSGHPTVLAFLICWCSRCDWTALLQMKYSLPRWSCLFLVTWPFVLKRWYLQTCFLLSHSSKKPGTSTPQYPLLSQRLLLYSNFILSSPKYSSHLSLCLETGLFDLHTPDPG